LAAQCARWHPEDGWIELVKEDNRLDVESMSDGRIDIDRIFADFCPDNAQKLKF
jgi:hypothetical protein